MMLPSEAKAAIPLPSRNTSRRSKSCSRVPSTITLHIPFKFVKCGGRKELIAPDGAATSSQKTDNVMIKALARAFRWKKMLEDGEFATAKELAVRENISPSYLTRVLRLTLLAPDLVEQILEGSQGAEVSLASLLEPFPQEWDAQRKKFAPQQAIADDTDKPANDAAAIDARSTIRS